MKINAMEVVLDKCHVMQREVGFVWNQLFKKSFFIMLFIEIKLLNSKFSSLQVKEKT